MTIKADHWIIEQAKLGMIEPFCENLVSTSSTQAKVISYGVSSYGYDARCAQEFKIFTNIHSNVVDPKNMDKNSLVTLYPGKDNAVIIPPNSFALTHTEEYFKIPDDVLVLCMPKSTYARAGIFVYSTVIEPGFEGQIVLEIANNTPLPARVYAGEGIAQFLFFKSDQRCKVSYKDRGGKYQGQRGITLPKL